MDSNLVNGSAASRKRTMGTNDSQEQTSLSLIQAEGLGRDEQCPVCGGDNQCRMAKGHLYKGPCWCEEISVPRRILRALGAGHFEPACLCRFCLGTVAQLAHEQENPETVVGKIRELLENSHRAGSE